MEKDPSPSTHRLTQFKTTLLLNTLPTYSYYKNLLVMQHSQKYFLNLYFKTLKQPRGSYYLLYWYLYNGTQDQTLPKQLRLRVQQPQQPFKSSWYTLENFIFEKRSVTKLNQYIKSVLLIKERGSPRWSKPGVNNRRITERSYGVIALREVSFTTILNLLATFSIRLIFSFRYVGKRTKR